EKDFRSAQSSALAALADYQQWLEKDLFPRSTGDFRIGDEKFRKKLRFALDSDLSKEEILRRAETDRKATRSGMFHTAAQIWPRLFPDRPVPMDESTANKPLLEDPAKKHPNN